MVDTARTAGAGRPRDTTIELRVLEEAIRQFALRGWAGLSIDKIAAATGVGKASIYLRWDSKEDLVLAAIERVGPRASEIDTGSLEGDLHEMIAELLDLYTSDVGAGVQRFTLDVDVPEALRERLAAFRSEQVRSWRRVVRRAIAQGWLPEDTPIAFLLNVVHGATWSYATTGSPSPRDKRHPGKDARFISDLIGLVIDRFAR